MGTRSRIGLVVATFGLVVAGLGTALALGAPAAAPPATVSLPRFSEPKLPVTTPPPLPPVVADAAVPDAGPTGVLVEQPVRAKSAPAPRPKPAPVRQQEHKPAPPPVVEVQQHPSVREDLRTLRDRIRAKVARHLERLKGLRHA